MTKTTEGKDYLFFGTIEADVGACGAAQKYKTAPDPRGPALFPEKLVISNSVVECKQIDANRILITALLECVGYTECIFEGENGYIGGVVRFC